MPLEFYEARNAVRIAKSEGADVYAVASYQHAVQLMNNADAFATSKHIDKKSLISTARQAVQTAEDSREIAVNKIVEIQLANERSKASSALTSANDQKNEAIGLQLQAQTVASVAQDEATKAKNEASNARIDTAKAQKSELRAITDKTAMRVQLTTQLNQILTTRDSARGLIVSMADVLFDSGQFTIKPGAREKLAKVAGILIAYPGLNIAVDGYTDNVGGDEMNQKLSENRASAVRDYLVVQGVASTSVTSSGFGNSSPVASNDTSAGRQDNRRVELVVSGDAIGTEVVAMSRDSK